jgi:CheY-like chemotaxis protein
VTNNSPTETSPALRVLMADDDESIAKTFGWMLEALGHEARVVQDGPAALAMALSFLPDVVMLDISLPGMNGYEVCQKMRAEPALAQCVFIAQTGWSQPEYVERSRKAGFHHHLVKPIRIDHLEKLLSSLSRKAAA